MLSARLDDDDDDDGCSFTWTALALNNPLRLICHQTKKQKPKLHEQNVQFAIRVTRQSESSLQR